jgi:hypothetical protein
MFLLRWYLNSISLHGELFSRSKMFLLFKGPVSFKRFFEIGGNVDELKAYRLITLTPPLPGHYTVPLKRYRPLICRKLGVFPLLMICKSFLTYLGVTSLNIEADLKF